MEDLLTSYIDVDQREQAEITEEIVSTNGAGPLVEPLKPLETLTLGAIL